MFVEVETQWNDRLYVNPEHITCVVVLNNGSAQINYTDGSYHIVKAESVKKLLNQLITD